MESVIATISQFGTRQTKAGEVFTLMADGVEYSTFKREIWVAAAPFSQQLAKILFSTTVKGTAVYRNLEGVEAVNGQPTLALPAPQTGTGSPAPAPMEPILTPDYARPKHPDDRRDIARSVALNNAVGILPYLDKKVEDPGEVVVMARYLFDHWLFPSG